MITNDAAYNKTTREFSAADLQNGRQTLPGDFSSKAVSAYDNYIKVEVILYCLKTESSLINVDDIFQSISALYKSNEVLHSYLTREFYYSCNEGLMLLPQNTPPQLVSDAYKAGVLCFYLPSIAD
ncbi:MAG: hypothetical protein ABIW38_12150 [Ferruginibacter sp.]